MANRKEYKKICEYCGEEYTTTDKRQRFCSVKCRGLNSRKVEVYTCEYCGKEFEVRTWDVKWRANTPKYCSTDCYHAASRKTEKRKCENCGKEFEVTPCKTKRFCSTECACETRRNKERVATQGKNGYKYIWFADGSGQPEHRYIIEKELGRKLDSNECVHHKDGNRANNDLDNLEVLTRAEHSKLHRQQELTEGKELFGRERDNL